MLQWIRNRMQRKGQSMVEFALILCLVAMIALVTVTMTGNQLSLTFQDIQAAVMNPGDAGGDAPYTCPGGGTATLHGHKYHCLPGQ
jgi:Flp pilus assembly pilin Flp